MTPLELATLRDLLDRFLDGHSPAAAHIHASVARRRALAQRDAIVLTRALVDDAWRITMRGNS